MIIIEKYIGTELNLIKKIVNDTSNKYKNFSHFIIKDEVVSKSKSYTLVLYFHKSKIDNEKKIYVEQIKGVFKHDIDEVMAKIPFHYNGYIKTDILMQSYKPHMNDLIITYKIPREQEVDDLVIIKNTGSGWSASDGYNLTESFALYKYTGKEYFECRKDYAVNWNLEFKYADKYILITKWFDKNKFKYDIEEYLFKIYRTDGNNPIKITKFEKIDEMFHGKLNKSDYEIELKDINMFVKDLFGIIASEEKVIISNKSYKEVEKHLSNWIMIK